MRKLFIIVAVMLLAINAGAQQTIQQSSTTVNLVFGPIVSSADNITPVTGLVSGTNLTVTLSKNGGAFAAPAGGAGSVTEVGKGYYVISANSTDNGTLGKLIVAWDASVGGGNRNENWFQVVGPNPYDSVRMGLTSLPNAAAGANGGLPTGDASGRVLLQPTQTGVTIPTVTTTNNALQLAGVTPLFDGSSYIKTNVQAVTAGATAPSGFFATASAPASGWFGNFPFTDSSGITTLLTRIPGTVQPQTGDSYARLGAPSGASIDADILTRLATSGYTTPPTVAQTATAVWQDLLGSGDFGTATSIGNLLNTNINASISSRSTYAGADTSGTTTLLSRIPAALAINGTGGVNINLGQSLDTTVLPLSNTSSNIVGNALWGGLTGQGVCKVVISGSTLSIYDVTGSTLIRSFTLSPAPSTNSSKQ